MTIKIRIPKLDKAKKFVDENQTLVACVATATVTGVAATAVTRRADMKILSRFAYNAGAHAGISEAYIGVANQFLRNKGLMEEFMTEFLPTAAKAAGHTV